VAIQPGGIVDGGAGFASWTEDQGYERGCRTAAEEADWSSGHLAGRLMLYIVSVTSFGVGSDANTFQAALQPANSWYRLSAMAWIICTDENAGTWSNRLRLANANGQLFICQLNPADRHGWMVPDFWTWFDSHVAHG
jgi:hypothetical protein